MFRLRRPFALVALAAALSLHAPAVASPPVFKQMTFEQAKAESVNARKLFIFDAMTSWCGPCKIMDKTTWVDESVVSWINDHAIAVQLDMDEHPELREHLRINAYPTIVVFKDGKEFDRIIGLKRPAEFLAWLKGVAEGESKLDQALRRVKEERAKTSADTSAIDFPSRLSLAQELYDYGSYDEATTEAAWLWEVMPAQASDDARVRLLSLMGNLAKRHAPAKTRFTAFRDAAAVPVNAGKPSREELTRWLSLNAVIADAKSSIDWALKMTDTPDNIAALRSVGSTVFPLLVEGGHWATAGKALANPVAEIDRRGSSLGAYDLPVTDAPDSSPKVMPAMPLMRKGDPAPAADAKKADAPKTMPAIPLARKGEPATATDAKKDDAPKTMPAIPLVRKGEPAAAEPASQPADAAAPKTIPAIPTIGAPGAMKRDDPASVAREVRYRLTLEFRDQAATYYAACLAAQRDEEAARIAELTFKYTDSPASRLALVERALKAGQPRREHALWLEEIETAAQAAAALRARLAEAGR